MLSRFHLISDRHGRTGRQTDRRTERHNCYHYRAIKDEKSSIIMFRYKLHYYFINFYETVHVVLTIIQLFIFVARQHTDARY